ncbi:hypothetical protein ACFQI7_29640 [Paenibacillus allorhizosphaerae]|uniref:Uncharacterized protein n=1 Tax=Paenibacillus allorhizosphaerae TaxID=2849866 RepID=A0ABM8VRK4_9BACL|nr:hypothetical protein [Paenibacillus allorhizosphaerae]CAG7655442.1 hypothetical protein PAECIP111802_06106 [Paenibacillus allorhizosphaerae]
MFSDLIELKVSFKTLTQNLISRIEPICLDLEYGSGIERLTFWLEDLSVFTETVMILIKNDIIDLDIELFNEKAEMLLDKVEQKDLLFISDLLRHELKPLLSYWDECITND